MTYITDTRANITTKRTSFVSRILTAIDLYKQRQVLRSLSTEQLQDIGLTASDVKRECSKSIWA